MMFLFKRRWFSGSISKNPRVCPGSVKKPSPKLYSGPCHWNILTRCCHWTKRNMLFRNSPISAQTTLQETIPDIIPPGDDPAVTKLHPRSMEVTNNPLKRSRHVFTIPKKLTSMNHQAWRVQQKTRHGVFSNEKVATFLTKKPSVSQAEKYTCKYEFYVCIYIYIHIYTFTTLLEEKKT